MREKALAQRMILCSGLQNGGTTLVSWCFLQRGDTNGTLDMPHDVIQTDFERVNEPIIWVKVTIASFRWLEICEVYRDLGWDPEPLLVVRDVRTTYSSLMNKAHGVNGTTAEMPPLRTRFRRFLQDWELFQANGWPIVKYEDLVNQERSTLQDLCGLMTIPWDEAMLTWPKPLEDIAYVAPGLVNATLLASTGKGSIGAAKLSDKTRIRIDGLPKMELDWLQDVFARYNEVHGYPVTVTYEGTQKPTESMPPPRLEGTPRDVFGQTGVREWRELHEAMQARQATEGWVPMVRRATDDIDDLVPPGDVFLLVDNGQISSYLAIHARALPFLERDGQYWGPPADDATAISELERLRQAGASFIVFAWPAFWWLDFYSKFHDYLRSHFACTLQNERLVAFDLREQFGDDETFSEKPKSVA